MAKNEFKMDRVKQELEKLTTEAKEAIDITSALIEILRSLRSELIDLSQVAGNWRFYAKEVNGMPVDDEAVDDS